MTLALGLAATFIGAAAVIAGVTNRPISRLLFGNWDPPGTSGGAAGAGVPTPGNAATGGAHAPSVQTTHIPTPAGTTPAGGPR